MNFKYWFSEEEKKMQDLKYHIDDLDKRLNTYVHMLDKMLERLIEVENKLIPEPLSPAKSCVHRQLIGSRMTSCANDPECPDKRLKKQKKHGNKD